MLSDISGIWTYMRFGKELHGALDCLWHILRAFILNRKFTWLPPSPSGFRPAVRWRTCALQKTWIFRVCLIAFRQ